MGQQVFAQNDYVAIVQRSNKPDWIFISHNGKEYKRTKLEEYQSGIEFNYTTALKHVRKYEKKGYEIVTSNHSGAEVYFLMRKEEE